jgi:serine/threonine protein kinase
MTLPERIIHGRYRVIYTVDDTAGVVVSCCRDEQTAGLVYVAEWTSLSPAERESLISAASAVQSRTIPGMCTLSDTYSDENGFTAVAVAPNAHTLGQTLRMRNGPLSEAEVISQTATLLTLLTSLHVMSTPVMLRVPTLADILVSDDGSWLVLPFVTLRSLARNASPYRAPELAGTADASPASDIYAVSAIAYHASTGIAPLTTEQLALGARFISPRSIVPGLSDMWEAVVIRGMQDKPSNRYQHATEMQAALQTMAILGASAPSIEQPLPVSFTTANGEQGSSANMIPGNVPSLISAATSPASTPSLRLGCVVALAATLTVVAIMLCVVLLLVLPGSPLRSLYDGELFRSFNSAATSPTALPSVSKAIVAATPTPQPSIQASNQPITAANAASLAATGVITNTTFGPVAWAPDGAILAVATANTVSLHESSQLTVMQRFDGHVGDITTLSWSSDSRYLASGASNDSVIHVYDTKLG